MGSAIQAILVQLIQMVPTLLPKLLKLVPNVFVSILVDLGVKQEDAQLLINEAITILDSLGKTALVKPGDPPSK